MDSPLAYLPQHQAHVILADPPWDYQTHSSKGWKKSAHAHYPCMSFYGVARAWGFEPKTMGAWAKQTSTGNRWQFGTGFILRSTAEFFLISTRGKPTQLVRDQRNLIVAPVREHSTKPDEMYQLIERMWPGPYIELFARQPRSGWYSSVRPWTGKAA
jgi:N6-adenosine-specific RNA methylase IME4